VPTVVFDQEHDVRRPLDTQPMGRPLLAAGDPELGFRSAALRSGAWLGWILIAAVVAALASDTGARHRSILIGMTLVACGANAAAMFVPWREWLQMRRGRALLDLLCGGLIGFVAVLVADGGPNFALLLFLTAPFIAVVQTGRRRALWLAASACTCALVAVLAQLPTEATAMRMSLVAVAVAVALVAGRTLRREAAAHQAAATHAELERTRTVEANHRITNNLQSVSDLLLLGRRSGDGGDDRLDEAAARIRSIAIVHRLLAERNGVIETGTLLRSISESAPVPVVVEAEPVALDTGTAQKLAIVANELITNASRHGASPITVRLTGGDRTRLVVDDGGSNIQGSSGLGLELVRRMVEQGLRGRFELTVRPGRTRAKVVFPAEPA
jgi:two-component sensor histidine kinase